MIVMAIVNQKGGVGKTTTTINLAAALSKADKRVLVVDLDPQRNATTTLNGGEQYAGWDVTDLIYHTVCRHPYDLSIYLKNNEPENVSFIPSTPMLASAPNILAQDVESADVLRKILRCQELADAFDYVLIDCKPSMDLLVTNALVAADRVVVPVQPEDYALDGLGDLIETINSVQARYNSNLRIDGILISRANMQRRITRDVINEMREVFGDQIYNTVIPDRADCAKAQRHGSSMVNAPSNDLGKKFIELAREVILHE